MFAVYVIWPGFIFYFYSVDRLYFEDFYGDCEESLSLSDLISKSSF